MYPLLRGLSRPRTPWAPCSRTLSGANVPAPPGALRRALQVSIRFNSQYTFCTNQPSSSNSKFTFSTQPPSTALRGIPVLKVRSNRVTFSTHRPLNALQGIPVLKVNFELAGKAYKMGSTNVVNDGLRGCAQRYKCKDCGRRFDGAMTNGLLPPGEIKTLSAGRGQKTFGATTSRM